MQYMVSPIERVLKSPSHITTVGVVMVGIVLYLHIEGTLYAQKSVPNWFLAVFDSKIDVCWNLKEVVNSLIPKFQLVTVKYYEVEALFLSRLNVVQKETMWSLILYVVCTQYVRSMYVVCVCMW